MANVYGFKMWVEAPQLNGNENDKEIIKNYEDEVATKLYNLLIQGGLKFKLDEYSGHIITDVVDGVSTDYMVGSLTNGVHLIILETSVDQKYNGSTKLTRKEIVKMLDGLDPVFENVKPIEVNDSDDYEFINVVIDPINQPKAYQSRVDSLIKAGFTLEEAKAEALMPIEMEVYFDPRTSLIMIDSGATESGIGFNPYTGQGLKFESDVESDVTLNLKSFLVQFNPTIKVESFKVYSNGESIEVGYDEFKKSCDDELKLNVCNVNNLNYSNLEAYLEISGVDPEDYDEIEVYLAIKTQASNGLSTRIINVNLEIL